MTRSHAKNATTQSILSHAERARLKTEGRTKRLGGESFRPFDACHLCLSKLVSPVSCSKGHMYCRECALSDLIQQKAAIEAQKREMERWDAQEAAEKEAAKRAARERVVSDFEKGMGFSLSVGNSSSSGSSSNAVGGRIGDVGDRKRTVQELTRIAEERAAKKIEEEQAEARKAKLPAFWLPSLAPDNKMGPLKDVKLQTICQFGTGPHPFSRKTLLPVQLHYPAQSKTPHCPSCSKEISNAISSVLMTSREPELTGDDSRSNGEPAKKKKKGVEGKDAPLVCGHVVCRTCADTIVKPQGQCCICEAKIGADGMIPLGKDGTGFAAAGGSEVKANTIVFRI